MDLKAAVDAYVIEVRHDWKRPMLRWAYIPAGSTGNPRLDLAVETLRRNGVHDGQDEVLRADNGSCGSSQPLSTRRRTSHRSSRRMVKNAFHGMPETKQYITTLLMAIRVFRPELEEADWETIKLYRGKVLQSLEDHSLEFARPNTYDQFLAIAFPRLASEATSQQRVLDAAYAKAEGLRWRPIAESPWDIHFCFGQIEQRSGLGMDSRKFLREAWAAREKGEDMSAFLRRQSSLRADAIALMIRWLHDSWLATSTMAAA
ncbi:hypothetical protein Ddc_22363 [Ditylenchus destructor]|nr:hypothetical protein Ddc_22363 [Ditylenchus destructor]